MEQDNRNTHHHLALMTRRTKVISKQEEMVNVFLKIWHHSINLVMFTAYQAICLSIFK